jgi:hypothetical protein
MEKKIDEFLIDVLKQNNTALAAIASNTTVTRDSISNLAKAVSDQTGCLNVIKETQAQFQNQSIKILLVIILLLFLVIGALLVKMNIRGGEAITEAVGTLLPGDRK